jgi:hypothetical protein
MHHVYSCVLNFMLLFPIDTCQCHPHQRLELIRRISLNITLQYGSARDLGNDEGTIGISKILVELLKVRKVVSY